jgi:hypothetical protein
MSDAKTARLEIKLTPELKQATEDAAARYGITPSDYTRALLGLATGFDPGALSAVSVIAAGAQPARRRRSRSRR